MDDSCTLGEVIDRAADEFGIHLSADSHFGNNVAKAISGVAVYRAGDEALADLPYDRFARRWPVVDGQGRLWFVYFCEATMAGLCRASAVGAIDGDVLRPYFRPTVPQVAQQFSATGRTSSKRLLRYGEPSRAQSL